jgi:hypothetical protein
VDITERGVMEGQGNFSFVIDTADDEDEDDGDNFMDDESWEG